MRLAFVLLTHTNLPQVERLVAALGRGLEQAQIVISHSGSEDERRYLASLDSVSQVVASPGGRGHFGLLDALLAAVRWLDRHGEPYDWLAVLSGQDYPIRPPSELAAFLEQADADGFFHHFDALNAEEASREPMCWSRQEVEDRYLFRYTMLKTVPTTLDRAILKVPRLALSYSKGIRLHTSHGVRIGARATRAPFTDDFRLHGGSFWVTIRRRAAEAILDFVDRRADVVSYFRDVIIPDEALLQTILANDRSLTLSKRELRYFNFSGGSHGHCQMVSRADLDRVMASGCFIARKFDDRLEPGILDEIDRRIAQRPMNGEIAANHHGGEARMTGRANAGGARSFPSLP